MDANKAKVRDVWVDARLDGDLRPNCGCSVLLGGKRELGLSFSKAEAWSAAAAFTETVLREAAELREEIAIQEDYRAGCISTTDEHAAITRTIARLEAAYAAHIRGIKPDALTTRAA